jgi:hypothetical protein
MVIVIGIRLDIIAVFYAIWLGLFLVSSRRTVQRIWPFYILFLTIAFPLQYMSIVGAPPFLCFGELFEIFNMKSRFFIFVFRLSMDKN